MSENDHIYNCYAPPAQVFTRGEGAYLYTDTAEKYLDFIAGIAVSSLGHANPVLVNTLKHEADKVWHLSGMFQVQAQLKLAQKYCHASFADKVFFTNSGAEAVETAIKTARRYQFVEGNKEKFEILCCKGAFHGRTIATVNAGGNPKYMEGFGPEMAGFKSLPFGDFSSIRRAINASTAAILVEPIQGEGGVRMLEIQFLKKLRKICNEQGLLLIYDEVQCGAGRTGKLFAHQWAGGDADPDIMAVAKGMGGGFPLGACLATHRAAAGMTPGTHGSTYGGGPLAMAIGNAVFDELTKPEFMAHVVEMSEYLTRRLKDLKHEYPDIVVDIRGAGLMLGLKLRKKALDIRNLAREHKLLVGTAGDNVLRMVPPLIITRDHVDEAASILDTVFKEARKLEDFYL